MSRLALAAFLWTTRGSPLPAEKQFQIEKLAEHQQFAAGPVWNKAGYLFFSDVPANRIYAMQPPASERHKALVSVFRDNANGPGGNALDAQGRLYTCETHARRVTRMDSKNRIEVLASGWQGKRLNSPHAIVLRRDGHIWFTDPAFGGANDTRELDFYGVFHINPKGELTLAAKWQTRPGGLALSPDGEILYVSDSDRHLIRAFTIGKDGNTTNERTLLSDIEGVPTGLCTGTDGTLYVAARNLLAVTPHGAITAHVDISEKPTACAFGDADGTSLYVTGHSDVYRVRFGVLQNEEP